ncbi:LLM class F420-dependent oxidoreductase [Amycolatopsis sp. NPDC051045]|uniref:LLM class F420-dependent oxidoreductase n=1 Tax=Amycolatopsis sp. NPDC051045 TaxID=3156922 RepID=UPI00344876FB
MSPGQPANAALHRIGEVGVWTRQFNFFPTSRVRRAVRDLEALGYGAVWVGETVYREPLTHAAVLLGATDRMVVATGIAAIWARDPFAATAAALTLAEAYPDRFVLGIGVSHASLVEDVRGTYYRRPLATMRDYLDGMDRAATAYGAVAPPSTPRLLAALGPRMLELAATRAQGALTYLVPPEHTRRAREILGPDAALCVEQALLLDGTPSTARAVARKHLNRYLAMPNYVANWRRLGFTDEDIAGVGSDRLVDALVSWGDPAAATTRVREHLDAGADHVCIQLYHADLEHLPEDGWRQVAETLGLIPGGATTFRAESVPPRSD